MIVFFCKENIHLHRHHRFRKFSCRQVKFIGRNKMVSKEWAYRVIRLFMINMIFLN